MAPVANFLNCGIQATGTAFAVFSAGWKQKPTKCMSVSSLHATAPIAPAQPVAASATALKLRTGISLEKHFLNSTPYP